MPTKLRLLAASVSVISLLTGCGRSKDRPVLADSTSITTTGVSADTSANSQSPNKAMCPGTGLWAICSVEKRLTQAGFVLRKDSSATASRAGFSVAPTIYLLGRGKLEVFLYPDAKSLERDWRELDTLNASPQGKPIVWQMRPSLVRSANLAALYFTDSPVQVERLGLAVTAGPPQPAAPQSNKAVDLEAVRVRSTKPRPSR
jgi:hypothetical protein